MLRSDLLSSITPPTQFEALPDAEPPATKWPIRLGIFSLIYAAGGLLCQIGVITTTLLTERLLAMAGMTDVQVPAATRYPTVATALLAMLLGLVLLIGAINLLRRRRSSISQLKAWALLRMLMVLLGVVVGIATLPANMEFQRQIQELNNQRAREGGRPDFVKEFDEQKQWYQSAVAMAVMSIGFSIYPMFLGFYLTRRSVREEVSHWQ